MGVGVAQADPFDPWIPGIPGPGVNIGVPGNPLPPGQVKKYIPNVDDVVPNWGAPGHWHQLRGGHGEPLVGDGRGGNLPLAGDGAGHLIP